MHTPHSSNAHNHFFSCPLICVVTRTLRPPRTISEKNMLRQRLTVVPPLTAITFSSSCSLATPASASRACFFGSLTTRTQKATSVQLASTLRSARLSSMAKPSNSKLCADPQVRCVLSALSDKLLYVVGHCRTRTLPDYHVELLPRSSRDHCCVRRHGPGALGL